jgi:hypothetical protein
MEFMYSVKKIQLKNKNMPGFNGKGPKGEGSQSGRGLGKCNNSKSSEFNEDFVIGLGRRRGNCRRNGEVDETKANGRRGRKCGLFNL